ncbi:alanine--tRNA ligase [Desulfobacterales bacterium HSG16]|nr:alanine--tRNA ligase [Desulfobacterales bacterium HSG16]
MTGNEIRKQFLDYFQKYDHRIVRSSSLVPQDDPTLLFVNAGMVQFKRTFLGEEKRGYVRATTSQKCVRAGGKHNDLENVGYTARHHTFFEMLGNFSFGDYFKEKAIEFAWDLLTNGYGLPEEKLWVSIYLDDDEAFDLWQKNIGVPEDRIVRFGEEDNFWAMGDTGPCGPCSEIHLDRGPSFGCGKPDCKLGCECDRYLEIWNLVFMQFNRDASGKMEPLPKPSIDTGMGLERIVSILQNTKTNYETDLLTPIISRAEELAQIKLGEKFESDVAMKVIADHSRAAAFLIGDGILPSNEGRGYVLRRIMRRAIRYGRNIGLVKPFLHETASVVFDIMKPAYPELFEARSFITNVIENEELRFSETLDKGLGILNDTLSEMKAKDETVVPGNIIFKLYDTFGFPVDIVRDVVRDRDMSLDMDGFDKSMAGQREQSGGKTSFSSISQAYKNLTAQGINSEFTGYNEIVCESEVLLIVENGNEITKAETGKTIEVVTKKTPFYGESGGQAGDCGKITGDGFEMEVTYTIKDPTGLIIHKGKMIKGTLAKEDKVMLSVDEGKRGSTALNHTATHILHSALREVLGDHVKQAGSLVSSDRLRFDFTHFSQVSSAELDKIETVANNRVRENAAVDIREMDIDEALKSGATALFEEKYADKVRVITLGEFSQELCGGTHTTKTGNIGLFKIVSEASVASGVRRIEAVTGAGAIAAVQKNSELIRKSANILKTKPENLDERIEKLLSSNKNLEKQLDQLKAKVASISAGTGTDETKTIQGVKVFAKKVETDNPAALRDLADKIKDKLGSGVIVLGSAAGEKVLLVAIVTKDLTKRFHAGNIIKQVAGTVGGSGGGRPDMAQAGGTKIDKLDDAITKAYEVIEEMAG